MTQKEIADYYSRLLNGEKGRFTAFLSMTLGGSPHTWQQKILGWVEMDFQIFLPIYVYFYLFLRMLQHFKDWQSCPRVMFLIIYYLNQEASIDCEGQIILNELWTKVFGLYALSFAPICGRELVPFFLLNQAEQEVAFYLIQELPLSLEEAD